MLLFGGFTLSSERCTRRRAVLRVASQLVLERERGTHAAILTGDAPSWLDDADAMLEQVYGQSPFTHKNVKGVLQTFREIFGVHPLENSPSSRGDLRALRARELVLEEFLEKLSSVENTDINELPGRDLLDRLYARIVCSDTMLPVRRMVLTILVGVKKKIRSALIVLSKDTALLVEAVNYRKKAENMAGYIDTLTSMVPMGGKQARDTCVDVPIPAGMSPDLRRCFSLDTQLDELNITHE